MDVFFLHSSLRVARLLLVGVVSVVLVVGCLPGKRDNTSVADDAGALDVVAAEDVTEGDGAVDVSAEADVEGEDVFDAGGPDQGPAPIPGGCKTHEDCAYLAQMLPCVEGVCNTSTGLCKLNKKSKIPCDDGNPCTLGDHCTVGKCKGTPKLCNDDNPCTDDFCDMASGCTSTDNTIACVSSNPCAIMAHCQGGGCVVDQLKDCTSSDVCKVGSCNASGDCILKNDPKLDGLKCDDGLICTAKDSCAKGVCGGVEKKCEDGNVCTMDKCDPIQGCVHIEFFGENVVVGCGLQDSCQSGTCADGKCTLGKSKCDDDNDCTVDTCDPDKSSGQCTHKKRNGKEPCDDGDKCGSQGECNKGQCFPQKSVDCDDFNVCTVDSCDSKLGCQHKAKAGSCNDGSACTSGDVCSGGKCGGSPVKDGTSCGSNQVCKAGLCI